MQVASPIRERGKRNFLPEQFVPSNWQDIEPFYLQLKERPLTTVEELKQWLRDWSEFSGATDEHFRRIYIRATIDTTDEAAKEEQKNLYVNILPKLSEQENELKKKLVACPFLDALDKDTFFTTIRNVRKEIALFTEKNLPLQSELNLKQRHYDEVVGAQSIEYNGQEITIQQALAYMSSTNRAERETVFNKIGERRLQNREELDTLLSELIKLRHQVALNAGYKNYIDYRFAELGRFDYTPQDCLKFHKAIEETAVPLLNQVFEKRRQQLGLDTLKPWDTEVNTSGKEPLKPFTNAADLIEKTIACFNHLDPYFAQCILVMRDMKYLDLESRLGKTPGGYNMPLPEIGLPFIFMNAAGTEHDLVTIVHEGGHAIQTFLTHSLELNVFKELPSEIAEVASMAMELLSMENWAIFYPAADDLKRAQKNHLEYIISILTRTSLGDSFQFWMYANPEHTAEERRAKWRELQNKFTARVVDWSGHMDYYDMGYQRILHFYEVPFYYIEYAFAQLGALAIWRNYKQNPAKAVGDYKNALSLGYTKPIPVFYTTAGAEFNVSEQYVAGLVSFLQDELEKLK